MSGSLPPITKSASMTLMPMREMYNISTRQGADWGIDGYEVTKKYFDHAKAVQDKIYEDIRKSGKATKEQRKVTKRGCFLDDEAACQKNKPGPQKYDVSHIWVSTADIEKGKKRPKNTKRDTFIDDIFKEQKLRNIPGPGKYNISKTPEQLKAEAEKMNKKIKVGDKANYLNDYEYLANTIPGPGSYNPRDILPKIHKDNMNPAKWITAHKEQSKKNVRSSFPDMGTYKANFPADYDTFGKMLFKEKEEPGKKSSVRYLGTEERFKDLKKSKSKSTVIVPGPGQYPMIPQWPGKDKPKEKDAKVKNYMNSISQGIEKSIYYS